MRYVRSALPTDPLSDDSGGTLEPLTDRRRLLVLGALGLIGFAGADARSADLGRPVPLSRRRVLAAGRHGGPEARAAIPPPPPTSPTPIAPSPHPVFKVSDVLPAAPANAIALTIDDGPHPRYTPEMLQLLSDYNVKATFSVIGVNIADYPSLVREIAAEGHSLSNHTQHHLIPFDQLPVSRMRDEVLQTWHMITELTGAAPKFFRSPGGAWSSAVLDVAAEYGMIPINWDIDPRDWARPGTDHITSTMLASRGGDVLLCHDGGGDRSETVTALHTVIPALQQRGLSFITL